MSFHETLRQTMIRHLNLPAPPVADATERTDAVIRRMREARCVCMLVVEGDRLAGVFTERDVLAKVVGCPPALARPVSEHMTRMPTTISADGSLDEAIRKMSGGGHRNLPVVDDAGHPIATLSAQQIVDFIVENYPQDVHNLPPRPEQQMPTPDGA